VNNDPCVLCRAHNAVGTEVIVVAEREFKYWEMTYQKQYEFIAKGTFFDMKRFQQLMKEE
jgi:hypothetical protein